MIRASGSSRIYCRAFSIASSKATVQRLAATGGLGLAWRSSSISSSTMADRSLQQAPAPVRDRHLLLTLPLLADVSLAAAARPSSILDESLLAGVRVLVVDDEADDRVTLGAILEQFGAQPTIVASARDALDAIAHTLPDVLLSDVAMPSENGYALIRRIRTTLGADRLPAAALSAYVDGDSKAQALDAGFQTYLSKPIEPTLLATTLASLIHRGV